MADHHALHHSIDNSLLKHDVLINTGDHEWSFILKLLMAKIYKYCILHVALFQVDQSMTQADCYIKAADQLSLNFINCRHFVTRDAIAELRVTAILSIHLSVCLYVRYVRSS